LAAAPVRCRRVLLSLNQYDTDNAPLTALLLACAVALANGPANVHPSRKCYRAQKVREHDRDLAAFGIVDDLAGAAAATASAASAPDVQYGLLLPPMCPPLFGRIDVKSEFD
jgi:hypothetical protein